MKIHLEKQNDWVYLDFTKSPFGKKNDWVYLDFTKSVSSNTRLVQGDSEEWKQDRKVDLLLVGTLFPVI